MDRGARTDSDGRRRLRALVAAALVLAPWGLRPAGDEESAALRARVAVLEAERASLIARVDELELELAREREARLAREREWLAWTRTLAELAPEEQRARVPLFGPQVPAQGAAGPDVRPEPTAAQRAAQRRADEVRASLRALLASEAVRGIDLLEVAGVHEGAAGPVVFRLLDGDGRLAGSLYAERLRLEASQAGRTLTLVLEDGHESRGGQRTPFGSAGDPQGPAPWRIPLIGLDPRPWIESLPELFSEGSPEPSTDDGRWDVAYVQATLNELLRQDTAAGWYRLKRLGGIQGSVLRDVHVEVLGQEGELLRRIFADSMTIEAEAGGVVLRFEGGVHERGEERTPFLEGGYRVWLPRAQAPVWIDAGLPGLVERPSGRAARKDRG